MAVSISYHGRFGSARFGSARFGSVRFDAAWSVRPAILKRSFLFRLQCAFDVTQPLGNLGSQEIK